MKKKNQRRVDVNGTGDSCHLLQPPTSDLEHPTSNFRHPTSCPIPHHTSPISHTHPLNKFIARFIHPAVLSNILLRESTLFMPDIFLKYET
jgi:hypothetical protein